MAIVDELLKLSLGDLICMRNGYQTSHVEGAAGTVRMEWESRGGASQRTGSYCLHWLSRRLPSSGVSVRSFISCGFCCQFIPLIHVMVSCLTTLHFSHSYLEQIDFPKAGVICEPEESPRCELHVGFYVPVPKLQNLTFHGPGASIWRPLCWGLPQRPSLHTSAKNSLEGKVGGLEDTFFLAQFSELFTY